MIAEKENLAWSLKCPNRARADRIFKKFDRIRRFLQST
jgi:hypothetical protein